MSDQAEQSASHAATSEEKKQQMLAHLDATRKAIEDLDEQELEAVTGGSFFSAVRGIERI